MRYIIYVLLSVCMVIGCYFIYYGFANPELTRTQIIITNPTASIIMLICLIISMAWVMVKGN